MKNLTLYELSNSPHFLSPIKMLCKINKKNIKIKKKKQNNYKKKRMTPI